MSEKVFLGKSGLSNIILSLCIPKHLWTQSIVLSFVAASVFPVVPGARLLIIPGSLGLELEFSIVLSCWLYSFLLVLKV